MLKTGTAAPDFTLKNQDGEDVSLSDYRGKKVVLYFYSKDNTSGCSAQACGYNDLLDEFAEEGAEVIGISKDSWESHRRFADKKGLRFTLLADPEREVIALYDVLKEKKSGGKVTAATVRSSYLIDENGVIAEARGNVKAAENPEDMLAALRG